MKQPLYGHIKERQALKRRFWNRFCNSEIGIFEHIRFHFRMRSVNKRIRIVLD